MPGPEETEGCFDHAVRRQVLAEGDLILYESLQVGGSVSVIESSSVPSIIPPARRLCVKDRAFVYCYDLQEEAPPGKKK